MVESRLARTACAALSSMVIHSLAGTTNTGRCCPRRRLAQHRTQDILRPHQVHAHVILTAASTAPRTSGSGALSEPIASTTMSVGISSEEIRDWIERRLACFFGHKHVAALIRSALAAGTVGKLALVAVRALGEAGRGQKIVAAALGSPLLGVAPFWIRHCSIPFNRPRRLREKTRESTERSKT